MFIDSITVLLFLASVTIELARLPKFGPVPMIIAMIFAANIGGNATPIGASANVVGTAIAEREGYPISWGRFMKSAVPAMIMVVAVCYLLLVVRYA